MKNSLTKYFVFILIGIVTCSTGIAQNEADNFKMLYKFNTVKQIDDSRLLEVSFIARNKKDRKDKAPVYQAEITFLNTLDTIEVVLGTVLTDHEGFARLTLPKDQEYLTDEEGFMKFKAVFEGTEEIGSKTKKLSVKDVFMDMEFTIVDSVYTVIVTANTIDSIGSTIPVEEADIILSVGGMISRMPIEEETLEDGEYQFEFPYDIPGDKNGDIQVFASIVDHDDFGNVDITKTIDWGTFDDIVEVRKNQLWSEAAPIWMYIVLSILLIGVWANYFYSVVNLFKIRKEGQEIESNSEAKD